MFLLAIDTTGREGFVALAEAASAASELHLLASVPLHGRRASEELCPLLTPCCARIRWPRPTSL